MRGVAVGIPQEETMVVSLKMSKEEFEPCSTGKIRFSIPRQIGSTCHQLNQSCLNETIMASASPSSLNRRIPNTFFQFPFESAEGFITVILNYPNQLHQEDRGWFHNNKFYTTLRRTSSTSPKSQLLTTREQRILLKWLLSNTFPQVFTIRETSFALCWKKLYKLVLVFYIVDNPGFLFWNYERTHKYHNLQLSLFVQDWDSNLEGAKEMKGKSKSFPRWAHFQRTLCTKALQRDIISAKVFTNHSKSQ